jgi:heme exporter protein A
MTLQADGLACVRGERTLFSDISFELAPGCALQVTGANGSGKTSLLRQLCGLAPPGAGHVRWQGRDVRTVRQQFNASLAWVGHADGVKGDLSATENLAFGATLAGNPGRRAAAQEALEQFGLGAEADLPVRALSQGQRKRVALAGLLLRRDRPLWILDEPFAALDQCAIDLLRAVLRQHLAAGKLLVYTTHIEVDLGGAPLRHIALGAQRAC